MNSITQLKTIKSNTASKVAAELSRTGGLLRLAPAWVPRSFLQPGLRIKLHPDDTYAYGLNRGGIDERWFASATEKDNKAVPMRQHRDRSPVAVRVHRCGQPECSADPSGPRTQAIA